MTPERTRLLATTDNPHWYARQLAALPMRFEIVGGAELREAVSALGDRLTASSAPSHPGC